MKFLNRKTIGYVFMLACFAAAAIFAPESQDYYAAWAMLPAVAIFVFIILTKSVIEGFLWSGVLAVFIKYRWGFYLIYSDRIAGTITDPDNAYLIIVFLLLGVLITFFENERRGYLFCPQSRQKSQELQGCAFIDLDHELAVECGRLPLRLCHRRQPFADE